MNNLGQYGAVQKIAIIFADAPIFFLPLFFIGLWFFYVYKKESTKKTELLVIFYSIVVAIGVNMIIQHLVPIQRPFTFLGAQAKFILNHIPDASFPSDHATVASAFLTAIFLMGYKKTFWIFLPFATVMFISRVIAGVHWPFDIIVGIIVGVTCSFLTYRFRNIKIIQSLNSGILKIAGIVKL